MANASLQIGNGNWAIKEDNLLGYSKSGTRFLPIPITMTRATLGTRVNPSGLVEDVALLGSELVSCGNFECANPDAVWSRDTGITISGGSANFTSVAGQYLSQNMLTSGKSYYLSFDVSDFTSGALTIFGGAANDISSSFIINSTGTYTGYFTAGGLDNRIYFGNVFTGSIDNVSVKEATIDGLARVDYTDGTGSLLVEPQRTNLFTYSEDFSQFPISNRLIITPNDITSPDGTINASKMQQTDGVTTAPNIAFPNVSAGTYTVSAFAKKGTRSFLAISFNGISYFDLQNGTITTTGSGHTASIENLGNDWYRCSIVKTISTTQTAAFYFADTNNTLTTADDEGYMYLYGTQLEQGSYPTSYIKTQGSTVTRNQDEYSKTGISDKINSEEGVLFVEMAAFIDNNDGSKSISLSSGGYSDNIIIQYTTNTNQIVFKTSPSYSTSIFQSFTVSDITQDSKMAFKYKLNDCSFWHNGIKLGSVSSFTPFSVGTLNVLNFNRGDGGEIFEGKVKQLQVFKTALSDSELATLTTI
jgi:hypothetical protein